MEAARDFCASGNSLYIVLTLSVGLVLYVWGVAPYRRSALVAMTGDLPGPKPLPFIGHLLDLIRHNGLMHLQLHEYYKKYGRVYALFAFGKIPAVVISDPATVKEILVKKFGSFHDRSTKLFPFAEFEPFRSMVIAATGGKWQRIRNILSPTFSGHKLKVMMPLMNASCDVMIQKLEELAKTGKSYQIQKFNQALVMDIILKTIFGLPSEAQVNDDDPGFKAAREALEPGRLRRLVIMISLLVPLSWKIFPSIITGHLSTLVEMSKQVVAAKKGSKDKHAKDMLDLILSAAASDNEAKRLTETEVIAQCFAFLVAGFDTVQNTLSLTCHSLATHPDVQEKLQQEIDSVWTDEDQIPSYDTVNQLPYLDMFISESLRLNAPGAALVRECTQDCVINGLRFKKGVTVIIDTYSIHSDPEFWPEPEKFDPERFTAEAKQSRDPYTYLAFGHGPRNCIGMRLAQLELKIMLIRILKKYTIAGTTETKMQPPIKRGAFILSFKPDEGMALCVKARKATS